MDRTVPNLSIGSTRADLYEGRITLLVVLACIVAANGGLIFGYDIGISGGVIAMDDFLDFFFPNVEIHDNQSLTKDQNYCKYNDQAVTAFTSSLYIAALIASLGASFVTRHYGRRPSILFGAFSFLIGAVLNAGALNLAMLILGRIVLGVGVGFGNQLAITIGLLATNMINYATSKVQPWGWRIFLGLAGIPSVLMFFGGLFLPETPNSLIERGYLDEGRALLELVRGTMNVDIEFEDLVHASEKANAVKHPFRNILEKRNRAQLVMAILIPFFQQLTGINAIMFYAPVLFRITGYGGDASLYSAVITGAINVAATLLSIFTVDRWGRRVLFLEAGVQMFLSHVVIGIVLREKFGGAKELSKGFAILLVVVICIYVSSFAWSWGPLGWLVPSEIFPLETRSVGQSITVSVNMLFTFIIAQSFLAMLCHFEYGIFLYFAAWVVIMSLFVYFFLPETKNVPIEEMMNVWREHWFWKEFVTAADTYPAVREQGPTVVIDSR